MLNALDTWWNDKYFYITGPRELVYPSLKKLFDRGVTLHQIQEIDLLGGALVMGDLWAFDIDNSASSIRRKRNHHKMRSFAPFCLDEAFLAEIEQLKSETEAKKESYRKLLLDTVRTWENNIQVMMPRCFWLSPLLPALCEFLVPDLIQHTLSRRGSKLDSWGSFFLLAVTEYMKQELDTPLYGVADDLLRAYRKLGLSIGLTLGLSRQFKRSEFADGKSKAINRIKNLKRLHPLWADALNPLFLQ